jgi:hypothetical protein
MIVSLCNTLSLYIGVIWRAKDDFQNNIWFGVMVVLHNSNVLEHGTLWFIIHDLQFVTKEQKVSKCARIISPSVMVKVRSMGQVPFWNVKFEKSR